MTTDYLIINLDDKFCQVGAEMLGFLMFDCMLLTPDMVHISSFLGMFDRSSILIVTLTQSDPLLY